MSRENILTVVTSVVLSGLASIGVNLLMDRHNRPADSNVVQARRVELVDEAGRARAVFGLFGYSGSHDVYPGMEMYGKDGLPALSMFVNRYDFGTLGFANNRWHEGAVELGYLGTGGDVDMGEKENERAAMQGGRWGLQVRSPESNFTSVGFGSDGRLLAPIQLGERR